MLGFHGDALLLSGPAGSQLKTAILKDYYEFWWKITSGGRRSNYSLPTAIVDMNAGSGELYIEETRETILGSAGHVLEFKLRSSLPTAALKLVLVEEHDGCFTRLKNVIGRRWPEVSIEVAEGPIERNQSGIYLMELGLDEALDAIQEVNPGNSIFFFDPLLHIEWETIEQVARSRIRYPLQTGTEFILFVFTSDWFTGREYAWREDLAPLPRSADPKGWTDEESKAVTAADTLFGDKLWRQEVLQDLDRVTRQGIFMEEYRRRLLKWFRFVLPLPFIPKEGQLYHLIFCSNYEAGIRVTRDFYCDYTNNPRYAPSNAEAYREFQRNHPETLSGLAGKQRPVVWKVLWQVIRHCEGGICDARCIKIREQGSGDEIRVAFDWLLNEGYITPLESVPTAWRGRIPRYELNWNVVKQRLKVKRPEEFRPITPGELGVEG